MKYTNVTSVSVTQPHFPDILVPNRFSDSSNSSSSMIEENEAGAPCREVFQDQTIKETNLISQSELNNGVRDLDLIQEKT